MKNNRALETSETQAMMSIHAYWESQKERKGTKRIFKETVSKNFPNLMKTLIYIFKKLNKFKVEYTEKNPYQDSL